MDMLRITGLHKRFGDKEVLRGLDLSVPEHSIYGFIGKNGSGKTTTMKTVLGLLKADSGDIIVNGEKVVYGQTDTNRYIGYLPDVPEFYSFMTAKEYLRFCGEITGMSRADIEERTRELLTLVGLADETHRIGDTDTSVNPSLVNIQSATVFAENFEHLSPSLKFAEPAGTGHPAKSSRFVRDKFTGCQRHSLMP